MCPRLGDLTKIAVNRYHPESNPSADFLNSFENGSGGALTDSASLNAASPCMEDVRTMCAEKLIGSDFGFYSYRNPTEWDSDKNRFKWGLSLSDGNKFNAFYAEYVKARQSAGLPVEYTSQQYNSIYFALGRESLKHMDTCMASSLQYRYGIDTLADKGTSTKPGVSSLHWQGTALLYKDCRPIEPWKQQIVDGAQCSVAISASFNEFTTPVSLLWSADVKIGEGASRSKFPLNPKEAGKWFVWRASGLTPLVVWDPEKSGSITSSNQLFGTHTWGKEWKNGYEALGSLDKDKSGWLEGAELANIALWFDFNQDGISDAREVKQLADVGVNALGVTVTSTDEKRGEVHAAKGFRRVVNGAVVEGASVDWFSGPEEGRFGMEALDETNVQVAQAIDKIMDSPSFDPIDGVSGMWDWRVVDQRSGELPENMPHGMLVLYSTNKEVSGTVYVMDQFAPNKSGISERVSFSPVTGVAEAASNRPARVKFSTKNQSGGTVESEAQLSQDGMYLAGITTEQQGENKAPVKYSWVARRYQGK